MDKTNQNNMALQNNTNSDTTESNINDEQLTDKSTKKASLKKEIRSWIIILVSVFLISFLLVNFVVQRTVVEGSSMESTLSNNDNLVLDKITYRFSNPKRFDIVVFPYRKNPSDRYIKRIIALPGETIQIKNSKIYINGEVLEENYGKEPINNPGVAEKPITLADDEYFVMGDNRNNSKDSRTKDVGCIKRSELLGRCICRFFPFNKMKTL